MPQIVIMCGNQPATRSAADRQNFLIVISVNKTRVKLKASISICILEMGQIGNTYYIYTYK